jgi:hypothetical protein
MHQTIRRFAAAASLAMILATPVIAAPTRDSNPKDRDRGGIVRIVEGIIKKLFGVKTTAQTQPPIPDPNDNGKA